MRWTLSEVISWIWIFFILSHLKILGLNRWEKGWFPYRRYLRHVHLEYFAKIIPGNWHQSMCPLPSKCFILTISYPFHDAKIYDFILKYTFIHVLKKLLSFKSKLFSFLHWKWTISLKRLVIFNGKCDNALCMMKILLCFQRFPFWERKRNLLSPLIGVKRKISR